MALAKIKASPTSPFHGEPIVPISIKGVMYDTTPITSKLFTTAVAGKEDAFYVK